jgi:hypothetical protein
MAVTSLPVRFTTSAKSICALGSGVDLSMMPEAGALDPADETCFEYQRLVDQSGNSIRSGCFFSRSCSSARTFSSQNA